MQGEVMKLVTVGPETIGNTSVVLGMNGDASHQTDFSHWHADEDERRRIARDLHDSAAQNLVAVLMHVAELQGLCSDERSKMVLNQCVELVEQSSNEIRSACYQLYPPCLDELGLSAALHRAADSFQKQTGVLTKVDIPSDLGRFGSEVEIALFRVVQDALAIAQRHSQPKQVSIRVRRDTTGLAASVVEQRRAERVRDLPLTKEAFGVGLMRARMEEIGGTLSVKAHARGMQVVAHVSAPPMQRVA